MGTVEISNACFVAVSTWLYIVGANIDDEMLKKKVNNY